MPIQDIMNAPTSFGPAISDQNRMRDIKLAQGASGVASSMASTELNRMKSDTMREKSDILKNFEGRTDSPEFEKQMMSVDPDLVMKMREKTAEMDDKQRELMKQRFEKLSTLAMMDNTEEKWNERGWAQPFKERERIISQGMTMQQAFDYQQDQTGGGKNQTALMKNHKFLMGFGIPEDTALSILTNSKDASPEKFERDLYKRLLGDGIVTEHDEAAEMARVAREHYFGGGQQQPGPGGQQQPGVPAPAGFQTSAGTSSGKDWSYLY